METFVAVLDIDQFGMQLVRFVKMVKRVLSAVPVVLRAANALSAMNAKWIVTSRIRKRRRNLNLAP